MKKDLFDLFQDMGIGEVKIDGINLLSTEQCITLIDETLAQKSDLQAKTSTLVRRANQATEEEIIST